MFLISKLFHYSISFIIYFDSISIVNFCDFFYFISSCAQVRQLSESVVHKTTLRNMRRLLRKLGFLTADGVVTLKGRVACEISTADELLSSELLFGGVWLVGAAKTSKMAKFVSCVDAGIQCCRGGREQETERQSQEILLIVFYCTFPR